MARVPTLQSGCRPQASARFSEIMKTFVYILKSIKNGKYYIGCTKNIERRFHEHNNKKELSTKYNAPYRLVFNQEFETISEARKIENKLKHYKRSDFIDKIVSDGYVKVKK